MKCEVCKSQNLTSSITKVGDVNPDIRANTFYDENGKQHIHNTVELTSIFVCSRGHSTKRIIRPQCWCGWKANA